MDETQVHLEAFELYYSMKPKRSYKRVAELLGVSSTSVDDWGRDFKWQDRVKERDKKIAEGVAEKIIDEEIDLKVKLYKAIDKSIDKYIDKLDKQEIVLEKVKDLDLLGRLWKELELDNGRNNEDGEEEIVGWEFDVNGMPKAERIEKEKAKAGGNNEEED